MSRLLRALAYLWAAPNTLLGFAFAAMAVLGGAHAHWRTGVLEVAGGALGRLARRSPFAAITLGHVILAVDAATLARVRDHEQVHVRQCERWGPLFLPAYVAAGAVAFLRGRRAYRDNRFEREAYAHEAAVREARSRAHRRHG